jgi:hypothetical protein
MGEGVGKCEGGMGIRVCMGRQGVLAAFHKGE